MGVEAQGAKVASTKPFSAGGGAPAAFVARAAIWVIALFALTRVPWVQQNVLLPFAGFQGRVGCGLFGTPVNSVFVGLSCTGTDPMALVVGSILAFPARWSSRLRACFLGVALILVLNTLRIGTLSLVVEQRELFGLLHYYLWPAFLIVVAASYAFWWMARVEPEASSRRSPRPEIGPVKAGERLEAAGVSGRSFAVWLVVLVGLFYLGSKWIFSSPAVLEVARWAAHAAQGVISAFGAEAEVTGNALATAHGTFLVTQSCVATPLVPVYLAVVLSLRLAPVPRFLALFASLPLFVFLGSARLLVLALPQALVGSHSVAIHAFYQVLAAIVIVVWLARRNAARAFAGGAAGALVAVLFGRALGGVWGRIADAWHLGHGWSDPQGALGLMPAFLLGFLVALWLATGEPLSGARLAKAGAALVVVQVFVSVALGELAVHIGWQAPVVAIRAVSLLAPIVALWFFGDQTWVVLRRQDLSDAVVQ